MPLYNIRSAQFADDFIINKLDSDLNPLESYQVSLALCSCPAGVRDTCRHRKMLPLFLALDRVDSDMLYDHDAKIWYLLNNTGLERVKAEASPLPSQGTSATDPVAHQVAPDATGSTPKAEEALITGEVEATPTSASAPSELPASEEGFAVAPQPVSPPKRRF